MVIFDSAMNMVETLKYRIPIAQQYLAIFCLMPKEATVINLKRERGRKIDDTNI